MRRARPHRLLLVLGTWLVGVAVATAVGFGALNMIGDRVTDRSTAPLSERAVRSAAANQSGSGTSRAPAPRADLPAAPEATSLATGTPGRAPAGTTPPAPAPQVRSFPGGVVAVRCQGGQITLRYAVPRDGYTSEVSNRGPAEVEVEFQGRLRRSDITIRCVAGVATTMTSEREDDRGGRDR